MKYFTCSEFKKFLALQEWDHEQSVDLLDSTVHERERRDGTPYQVTNTIGASVKHSWLEGVGISYREDFNFDEFDPNSFVASEAEESWEFEGFEVCDDQGDQLSYWEIAALLPDEFRNIDYDGVVAQTVVPIETHVSLDDGDDDLDDYELQVDYAPSISFRGELIASTESSDNNGMGIWYSGEAGRYTELEIYKSKKGRYVCSKVDRTRWYGDRDSYSVAVCDTLDEVFNFFGFGWLAKDLYRRANIEPLTFVM